jgi:hypothetical protein
MNARARFTRRARIGFFILNVGSYLILSTFGEYTSVRATAVWAMVRVDWAPVGFVIPNRGWNFFTEGVYFPLYLLDRLVWHTDTLHSAMAGPLRHAT